MSTQTGAIGLPSRFDLLRTEGFPLLPVLIIGGIAFVAVFADVLAPHDPEVGNLGARFRPPVWQAGGSHEYLLGTDHLGRDVLSRLIFGARVSMVVGFTAVIFAGVVGTVAYPALTCGGELWLLDVTTDSVVLGEQITYGEERCPTHGIVTVKPSADGALEFQRREAEQPDATPVVGILPRRL